MIAFGAAVAVVIFVLGIIVSHFDETAANIIMIVLAVVLAGGFFWFFVVNVGRSDKAKNSLKTSTKIGITPSKVVDSDLDGISDLLRLHEENRH